MTRCQSSSVTWLQQTKKEALSAGSAAQPAIKLGCWAPPRIHPPSPATPPAIPASHPHPPPVPTPPHPAAERQTQPPSSALHHQKNTEDANKEATTEATPTAGTGRGCGGCAPAPVPPTTAPGKDAAAPGSSGRCGSMPAHLPPPPRSSKWASKSRRAGGPAGRQSGKRASRRAGGQGVCVPTPRGRRGAADGPRQDGRRESQQECGAGAE